MIFYMGEREREIERVIETTEIKKQAKQQLRRNIYIYIYWTGENKKEEERLLEKKHMFIRKTMPCKQ